VHVIEWFVVGFLVSSVIFGKSRLGEVQSS